MFSKLRMALGPNSIEVDFGMTCVKTVYPDNMGETVHLHTFFFNHTGQRNYIWAEMLLE